LYNLEHAHTVIRGNIRYEGFAFIIQCLKHLNLFSFDNVPDSTKTWKDLLYSHLKNPYNEDIIYNTKRKYLDKDLEIFVVSSSTDNKKEKYFYLNLAIFALSQFDDRYIAKQGFILLFKRLYSMLKYFDFYNEGNKVLLYISTAI